MPRTDYELASPLERERRGPFVCVFAHNSKQTLALYETLRAAQVFVSLRENPLRVSPRIYNTPEEISRFRKILSE